MGVIQRPGWNPHPISSLVMGESYLGAYSNCGPMELCQVLYHGRHLDPPLPSDRRLGILQRIWEPYFWA
jgi:hypothetical protein